MMRLALFALVSFVDANSFLKLDAVFTDNVDYCQSRFVSDLPLRVFTARDVFRDSYHEIELAPFGVVIANDTVVGIHDPAICAYRSRAIDPDTVYVALARSLYCLFILLWVFVYVYCFRHWGAWVATFYVRARSYSTVGMSGISTFGPQLDLPRGHAESKDAPSAYLKEVHHIQQVYSCGQFVWTFLPISIPFFGVLIAFFVCVPFPS